MSDADCTPGREPRRVAASFPSYPPDSHHTCHSDDVYWREGKIPTKSSVETQSNDTDFSFCESTDPNNYIDLLI